MKVSARCLEVSLMVLERRLKVSRRYLEGIKSGLVKSGQVKSGQINSGQESQDCLSRDRSSLVLDKLE